MTIVQWSFLCWKFLTVLSMITTDSSFSFFYIFRFILSFFPVGLISWKTNWRWKDTFCYPSEPNLFPQSGFRRLWGTEKGNEHKAAFQQDMYSRFLTIHVSVVTIRCQYMLGMSGGGRSSRTQVWTGLQWWPLCVWIWCWGRRQQGGRGEYLYHVTYPMMHVVHSSSTVNRQVAVKTLPSRNLVCGW